jgi:hypothetical protein
MKIIIDMCFILLLHTLINASFIIVISCEGLHFHPSLIKVCTKIIIYNLILQQQGCVFSPYPSLTTFHKKGVKESKRPLPNLINL